MCLCVSSECVLRCVRACLYVCVGVFVRVCVCLRVPVCGCVGVCACVCESFEAGERGWSAPLSSEWFLSCSSVCRWTGRCLLFLPVVSPFPSRPLWLSCVDETLQNVS